MMTAMFEAPEMPKRNIRPHVPNHSVIAASNHLIPFGNFISALANFFDPGRDYRNLQVLVPLSPPVSIQALVQSPLTSVMYDLGRQGTAWSGEFGYFIDHRRPEVMWRHGLLDSRVGIGTPDPLPDILA